MVSFKFNQIPRFPIISAENTVPCSRAILRDRDNYIFAISFCVICLDNYKSFMSPGSTGENFHLYVYMFREL